MRDPSFASLLEHHACTPIAGCPGRYLVRDAERTGVAGLVGAGVRIERHVSVHARDPVLVACLTDGGLISYEKPDRTFVHTLCDAAGFVRKLAQLGIEAHGA